VTTNLQVYWLMSLEDAAVRKYSVCSSSSSSSSSGPGAAGLQCSFIVIASLRPSHGIAVRE